MKVLSLFDGISCGQIALNRAEIPVEQYYASEIDKNAIKVTLSHYPNTVQLGCVKSIGKMDVDLLIAGSPCQGFSFAGKKLNFEDPRSKLFFEFIRIKNEIKPKWWLLENVNMKKEYIEIINSYLGEPKKIDSADFCAQGRKRLYWTNIPIKNYIPQDVKISKILENNVDEKYYLSNDKVKQIFEREVYKGKITKIDEKYILQNMEFDLNINNGVILPCITPCRIFKENKGPRFRAIPKSFTLTCHDIHGVLLGNKIRRLTPLEYERLQTLPDNYTFGSDSSRYKMVGNCWTVDVVAHIFKGLK